MRPRVHLDFETRSPLDLTKVGVYRYAEDPDTAIWLFSYRFDDGDIQRWTPDSDAPETLYALIAAGCTVVAHNANFERQIWNSVYRRRANAPRMEIAQMDCTMARALALHLPADLETLAETLGVSERKDMEGSTLMKKMMKPRKRLPGGRYEWWDQPENIARLADYCDQDVRAECEVDKRLPPLSPDERALWELDQKINDRGVALDIPMIERCVGVLKVAQDRAHARMSELTSGMVTKCTQGARIIEWLKARGLPATSIAKAAAGELLSLAEAVDDELAVQVLELRAETAKSSTSKFHTMLEMACADGRIRGTLQYHRASTGRWGGAVVQPQNLPRVDEETELPDVLGALELLAS